MLSVIPAEHKLTCFENGNNVPHQLVTLTVYEISYKTKQPHKSHGKMTFPVYIYLCFHERKPVTFL